MSSNDDDIPGIGLLNCCIFCRRRRRRRRDGRRNDDGERKRNHLVFLRVGAMVAAVPGNLYRTKEDKKDITN